MSYTKKAFYLKFIRYQKEPPTAVATIRVDYDPADGEPLGIHIVNVYRTKGEKALCPEPSELEEKFGVPTGLCSWHYLGIPAMLPAHRPYIIGEAKSEGEVPVSSAYLDKPTNRPISISTRKPEPEPDPDSVYDTDPSHYCKDCHTYKGEDPCECENYDSTIRDI